MNLKLLKKVLLGIIVSFVLSFETLQTAEDTSLRELVRYGSSKADSPKIFNYKSFLERLAVRFQIFENVKKDVPNSSVNIWHAFLSPRDLATIFEKTEHKKFSSKLEKIDHPAQNSPINSIDIESLDIPEELRNLSREIRNPILVNDIDDSCKSTTSISNYIHRISKAVEQQPTKPKYMTKNYETATGLVMGGAFLASLGDSFCKKWGGLVCAAGIVIGLGTRIHNLTLERSYTKDRDFYSRNLLAQRAAIDLISNRIKQNSIMPFHSTVMGAIKVGLDGIVKEYNLPY
jgi:hypothetical protein